MRTFRKRYPSTYFKVVKGVDTELPITVTAQTVDFEFYWEKKAVSFKNCK
jgi:hypothetical protein